MSSVVANVRMCGWEGDKGGSEGCAREPKMGQLTLSVGPASGSSLLLTKSHHSKKEGIIFTLLTPHVQ
jgi:hypothetical protein